MFVPRRSVKQRRLCCVFLSNEADKIFLSNEAIFLSNEADNWIRMRRLDEYKKHAKDCRALAAMVTRPDDKLILEEIAKAW